MPRKAKHKPRVARPNANISATRKSGAAGVQIRKLLLSLMPNTVKGLVIDTELPISTVHYHLITLMTQGKVQRKLVEVPGRAVFQYFI